MKNRREWEQRFGEFLDHIRTRYRHPVQVVWSCEKFWNWFCQSRFNWEDGEEIFGAYIAHLQEREPPYAPLTIYNHFRNALNIAEHFSECGYILWLPKSVQLLKSPPKVFRTWVPEPEEIQRLLELPNLDEPRGVRNLAILELFYGSGPRLAEMCRLTLADVDLWQNTVLIRDTKNGEDRVVPMTELSRLALRRYLKTARPELARNKRGVHLAGDALWLGTRQRPLGPIGVSHMIRRYARQLDLPITAHVLRHACATHLLQAGAGIGHIAAILGHTSLESTQIYTHLKTLDLRAVIQRSHPRAKPPEFEG